MANIGKVILTLEAQSSLFTKGIKESVAATNELHESVDSIKNILAGAFAFAGIEMGVSRIEEIVSRTIDLTTETYRLSSALGITTASLQSLQTAGLLEAGMQAEEFNGVLNKMTKSLGSAEGGAGPAADALNKLGLSGKELKGMHIDDAFTAIAQRISEVKDPLEQAHLAVELFGKQGQRLLPLFQEGAGGIAKAAEEAKRFGVAMSDTDAAKVMAAKESFEKVNLAIEGVENQLTIALAPVLEEIANKIISIAPAADSMRAGTVTALKYIAEGVGLVIDAWNVLKLGAQGVSYGIVGGIELVIFAVNKLAEGIAWVANKLGADWHVPEWMSNVQSSVDQWRNQIGSDMAGTVEQLKTPNSTKWGAFFDDIQAKSQETAQAMADKKHSIAGAIADDFEENAKKIGGIIAGLQQQIATFGMSEADKKVFELKADGASDAELAKAKALADQLDTLNKQKNVATELASLAKQAAQFGETESQKKVDDLREKGASPEQIKQAEGLNAQIERMKEWKKEQEDANKLIENSLTPQEKYQQQIDKVQKLLADGLIDQKTFDDQMQKANKALHQDDTHHESVAKVERRFDFRLPTPKPQNNDPAHQQLVEAKTTNKVLSKIANKLGDKPKVRSLV